MQSVEIYMAADGQPLGQLPFSDSIDHLENCARQHPRLVGEYRALIQRLQQLGRAGSAKLKLVPSQINRSERLHLQHLVSSLIFNNVGTLYCPRCNAMIKAQHIVFEEFRRGKYAEKSVSGRRFYCNRDHMLFEHLNISLQPSSPGTRATATERE